MIFIEWASAMLHQNEDHILTYHYIYYILPSTVTTAIVWYMIHNTIDALFINLKLDDYLKKCIE